jgi:hypothetical protein
MDSIASILQKIKVNRKENHCYCSPSHHHLLPGSLEYLLLYLPWPTILLRGQQERTFENVKDIYLSVLFQNATETPISLKTKGFKKKIITTEPLLCTTHTPLPF